MRMKQLKLNGNKKSILILSIFAISLILLLQSSLNSLALQDDDDLETTIHSYFETNSADISSPLMGLGTYDFFDAPELDDGTFNHDLTKVDVERVQLVEFNSTDYQSYMVREGVDDGSGNHTFEFNQNIPQYEISKELDTQISVIMNYSALDYENMETFTDDMEKADYTLINDDSDEIEIVEVLEHVGNESFTFENIGDSGASEIDFIDTDNRGCTSIISDIDGHEMVLKLDKQTTDIIEDIYHDFDTPQTSDTVEYWVRPEQLTEPGRLFSLQMYGGGSGRLQFYMSAGYFTYYDGSTQKNSISYSIDKWYRIRIDFNVASTWGFYIYDSNGITLLDSESGLSFWDGTPTSIYRFTMNLHSHWMDPQPDVTVYIDGFGKVSDPNYNLGDNIYPAESIYCSDDQITELTLTSDVYSEDQQLDDKDDLLVGLKTNTTKSVDLQLLKESVLIKEFEILATGNLIHEDQIINISITERLIFDQVKLAFILDENDWIQFYFVKSYGYTNDLIFSHAYVEDFEYQILGVNYTDTLELARDTYNSDHKVENGTHVYYFSSSDLSNFDHSNNLVILDQGLNVTYNYANDLNMNLNFSLKINYSSNSWKLPSQVNLKINDEDVSDLTLNSGVVYLDSYPETLEIEGDSEVIFELNFTITFAFKLNLDVISRTYLKKSFKLLSDHSIYIESLDLPDSLEIKKIYLNSNDLGSDNPNVLSPHMEMGIGYIFSLEVILSDDIYIPLNYVDRDEYDTIYSELFGYETSEMNNSFYPDSHNSTYNIDGTLNMDNDFPSEFHSEDWNDWNSQNDSLYTETSHENGNFSSMLNIYNNSIVPKPTDFTFINGSFNSTDYGNLNNLDGNYTILNSTKFAFTGTYPAEYSFIDDADGSNPTGWTVVETGGTVNVIALVGGHSKITELHDTGANLVSMKNSFSEKASGTIEFWARVNDNKRGYVSIYDGTESHRLFLFFDTDNKIKYGTVYSGPYTDIQAYSVDTWYHFRIEFTCGTGWHLWINKIKKSGAGNGYGFEGTPSSMDNIIFKTHASDSNYYYYSDAVDYSWSDGYYTNRNYEALAGGDDAFLNFTVKTQLDTSMVYSNDTVDWINLKYSYNTSTSFQGVNFSIWNFNTNQFDIINNSAINDNFYECNYELNLNQYNSTYHVILKIDGINATSSYKLYLDELKIEFNWTKTSGDIYSYFQKDVLYSFTNLYDSNSIYQKLYNISLEFSYFFNSYSNYPYFADYNNSDLQFGEYDFNDEVGNQNTDISFIDNNDGDSDVNATVIDSFVGRNNVMEIYDYNPGGGCIFNSHISDQTAGSISFFVYFEVTTSRQEIMLVDDGQVLVQLRWEDDGNLEYKDETGFHVVETYEINQWYYVYIEFDEDIYTFYIDGVKKGEDIDGDGNYADGIDDFAILSDPGSSDYRFYFDSIDYSWETTNYNYVNDFVFDSTTASNFTVNFNITNGLLQISEMNYTIIFQCLDINNKTRLYQYYKLDPVFNLNYYEKTEGEIYLNFSFDLTGRYTIKYDYYYPISEALFLIIANVQTEDSWINISYEYNLTESKIISLNILELINNNSKSEFRDLNLEFYVVGDVSVEIDDLYLYKKLQKIQVDKSPRTDVDSVDFIDYLTASRSFSYWYFQNNIDINSVDLTNLRTSETIETFEINNSRYYFQESIQSNDILSSNLDYNPNWNVSYEVIYNTGIYSLVKIKYKADLNVENVTIVFGLDACYNTNWNLNATQNSNNFIVKIPSIAFSTSYQTLYLEGYSDTPLANITSFESDQNMNQLATNTEITFAGFIEYPKYTKTFILPVETKWKCYDVYYGNETIGIETVSTTQIFVSGDGFNPSINDSYLHLKTKPFTVVDWQFDNEIITITIVNDLDVDNVYFEYDFNPSGSHTLEVLESNKSNNIEIRDLSDSGDHEGKLYFSSEKILAGKTVIKIHVNFATPLEILIQSILIFGSVGTFIGVYYYFKKNDEARQKVQKFVSKNIMERLEKMKKEKGKGFEKMELEFRDNKIYLENKK